jgi:hypothetical protein
MKASADFRQELTRHKADHIWTTASGTDTAAAQWGCLTKTRMYTKTQANWTPEYTYGKNRMDGTSCTHFLEDIFNQTFAIVNRNTEQIFLN